MSREQKALVQNAGRLRYSYRNLPMCRLASVVRSAGGVLRFESIALGIRTVEGGIGVIVSLILLVSAIALPRAFA